MYMLGTATTALGLLAIGTVSVAADDLEQKDVPPACTAICGPIVTLSKTCDITSSHDGDMHSTPTRRWLKQFPKRDDHDDVDDAAEDAAERECICGNTSFDVARIASLCAACLAQNVPATPGQDRDGVDDINQIMSQCSFTSTTYLPEATTAVADVTVSATKPVATTATSTTGPAATGNTGGGAGAGSSAPAVKVPGYGMVVPVVAGVLSLAISLAWR